MSVTILARLREQNETEQHELAGDNFRFVGRAFPETVQACFVFQLSNHAELDHGSSRSF
jgi:hypothetical protein